jgi:hypothetical protein
MRYLNTMKGAGRAVSAHSAICACHTETRRNCSIPPGSMLQHKDHLPGRPRKEGKMGMPRQK